VKSSETHLYVNSLLFWIQTASETCASYSVKMTF